MGLLDKFVNKEPEMLSFFAVTDKLKNVAPGSPLPEDAYFYAITATKEQAMEYLTRMCIGEHAEHYLQWCELHNRVKEDLVTMAEYIQTTEYDILAKYDIGNIRYTKDNLAVILRLFSNCLPLGCTYENQMELEEFMLKQPKEN